MPFDSVFMLPRLGGFTHEAGPAFQGLRMELLSNA